MDARRGVKLVQHTLTGAFFVRKKLLVYDLRVFRYLAAHPCPGIPRIRELIEDGGALWVVEEYVPGPTLRELLDRQGPFPPAQAAQLLRQLCAILAPLHALSPPIVHRDIKPANLILTPDGRLVLVDFNAAKASRPGAAQDTLLIGTSGYAAPEQYGFAASQPPADVYAMGALLCELLTGALPGAQTGTKPAAGALAPVLEKCLQMDPAARYPTAAALGKALRRSALALSPLLAQAHALLPPGLRTQDPLRNIAALLWYFLMVVLSCALQVSDVTPRQLTVERIFFFLLLGGETLWLGNYRGVWRALPLTKSASRPLRALGAALWGVLLACAILLVMGLAFTLAG